MYRPVIRIFDMNRIVFKYFKLVTFFQKTSILKYTIQYANQM